MARPLFSDMLYDRRRQLGLSIKQASNVLRLKEEVLIAFEEGDFGSIPKSGYAQGMLSSYARYLGLNAKTVVNQFSQDLLEHERGVNSHEARRNRRLSRGSDNGPLYQTPQAAANMGPGQRTYVESRGFLPTSGGFAGDMGEFATTSPARPRYRSQTDDSSGMGFGSERPYTSRVPSTSMSPLGQAQRARPMTRGGSSYGYQDGYAQTSRYSTYGTYGYAGGMERGDVTTRRVMPSQYRDDMRLDNEGGSYETASSTKGRRSSRNIASTKRPNVQRRNSRSSREQLRDRDRGASGGLAGLLQRFFADRGRVVLLIVALLGLVLTATIILSVRSCVSQGQSTGRSVTVTSNEAEEQKDTSTVSTEEEQRAREEAAAAKAAEAETSEAERTIEVTVADGGVTWLEVEYDGVSDVAETVTGPWNRTYTVRKAISINVGDSSAVTVTENGRKLEFDSKASGINAISIQVSKNGTAGGDAAGSSDTQAQDGTTTQQDGTVQDGQQTVAGGSQEGQQGDAVAPQTDYQQTQQMGYDQVQTTQQTSGSSPYPGYTLDTDGYYYGPDGYFDANGNFYQY